MSIYVQIAEDYVNGHIIKLFPEICKSIQHHRAEYYLLIHEYHFIHKLLKNGQIEEKEKALLIN